MLAVIASFVFMLLCIGAFAFSFAHDRSRYRNCYLMFMSFLSVIPFALNAMGSFGKPVIVVLADIVLIAMLLTPYFLIHNGIVMIKKEGCSIPHLLSIGLGTAILLGQAVLFSVVIAGMTAYDIQEYIRLHDSLLYQAGILFGVTIVYGSMSVLIFTVYLLLLQIPPKKKDFDYVIILGSGLINGDKVPKLLGDRIDKAITVYKNSAADTKLIPSGGQGNDETVPEAVAMKKYLLEKGITEEDIIVEDKSATTFENLTNSKEIIDKRKDGKNIAIVSSNYHVFRALRICRRIGFKCTGIGGHTAFYFWPCAVIREYIAVHAEKKHAVVFALGWVICIAVTIYFMRMQ